MICNENLVNECTIYNFSTSRSRTRFTNGYWREKVKKKVRRVRATTQNNAILLGNFENNAADLFYGSAARFASHVYLEMLVRRFRVECDKCMSHK